MIFDLDGTLTDSAAGVVASFLHTLKALGADVPSGDLAALAVGPPMQQTLAALGFDPVEGMAVYRADYTSRGWAMNRLFDGVEELLTDLSAAGVRLAVATSKAEPVAQQILEHFGVADHFEVIAGASLDGSRVAKADVLAHALAQLDPLPDGPLSEHTLMIGDRVQDVEGATEHGIPTVVVGWGYGAADDIDYGTPGAGIDRGANTPAVTHAPTIADLREILGV